MRSSHEDAYETFYQIMLPLNTPIHSVLRSALDSSGFVAMYDVPALQASANARSGPLRTS